MRARALIVAGVVLGAAMWTRAAATAAPPVNHLPLAHVPTRIGAWVGTPLPDFDDKIKSVLGADDYLNRRYTRDGAPPIDLYVAYYRDQRQGDAIHSPQNCLPGSGWTPTEAAHETIETDGGARLRVNRYVVEKNLDRRLVYYWYQGRGRVIASEYANKIWLAVDALKTGRTDGALVRVMVPWEPDAAREATGFVAAAYASLTEAIP